MNTAANKKRTQQSLTDVVVYLRVSTQEQGDSGLGLDAQAVQCQDVARRLGLSIISTHTEIASGKIPPSDRPVLMAAIGQCQASGARLLVAKCDRLSRDLYDVIGFCDKRTFGKATPDLITAESPMASPLEIRIRAVVAQEERDLISKRTSAAIKQKQAANPDYKHGAAGVAASQAKARAATQEAINRALALRDAGLGYKRAADTLNAEGYRTSRGGEWSAPVLRSRLLNRVA